jgi:hypothetical protein
MIEKWWQVTCDGCGEPDNACTPNLTLAEFREELKLQYWKVKKGKEFCAACVHRMKSKRRNK